MIFLLLGVPIAMIYIGIANLGDCPVEPKIPVFLISTGVLMVVRTIWYFIDNFLIQLRFGDSFQTYIDRGTAMYSALLCTLYLFGLYWIFHVAWPNLEDPQKFSYCNPATYLLAFISVCGILVLLVFWFICIVVLAFKVIPVELDARIPGAEIMNEVFVDIAENIEPNTTNK